MGIEVGEVNGNHDKKIEKLLSGSRITKKDPITKIIGNIIKLLLPELLGSVMIEAIAASIEFQSKIPIKAKTKNINIEDK
jgi:hypothetical protein